MLCGVTVLFLRLFPIVAALMGCLGLIGCAHTPVSLTVFEALGIGKNVDAIKLNPKLRYLRVSTPDRVALMVLGYSVDSPEGAVETWYSSGGEVLKLQNGRVVSSAGLYTDWRSVKYSGLPTWRQVIDKKIAEYSRTRDQMPAYKFGIQEQLVLGAVATPDNTRLLGVSASALHWFEETVKGSQHGWPSARYAIGFKDFAPTVVYGEQCFANDRCISWQTWPASF